MVKTAFILLAAGSSTRMGTNKLALKIGGVTPIERCFGAICRSSFNVSSVCFTVSDLTRDAVDSIINSSPLPCPIFSVEGGKTRGESVYNALLSLPADTDIVVIHDSARCLITPETMDKSIQSAIDTGSGIVGTIARDTIRKVSGELLNRNELFITQTPQTFRYKEILKAYEEDFKNGFIETDDCAVYEKAGYKATLIMGDIMNQKLTCKEDVPFFNAAVNNYERSFRVGFGEDTHRLGTNRKLILGGVDIPFGLGLIGHSDADVLIHAIIDALLGAAALGDIGKLFPDNDMQYKDISSLILLKRVHELFSGKSICINNIDATIIAQSPKLAPRIDSMRKNIASTLNIDISCVSVKATTPEQTGPEGHHESITARAVASVIM